MKNSFFLLIMTSLTFNISISQEWQIDWQQCFGGTENDYATDIVEKDSIYLIIGVSKSPDGDVSFNHGGDDGWLVQTDMQGNLLWEKTYGGSSGDGFFNILESANGYYYLVGGSNSNDGDITNDPYPNTMDFWIVKIDSSGNIIWERIVGGNAGDHIVNGILTSDNGIIAIGYSGSSDGDISVHYGLYDIWMIKLNSEGETEWDFTIGNTAMDFPGAIIETSDGGYLVGGSSEIIGGGNLTCETNGLADAVIIKLDSLRNIEWQQCYGGSEYDGALELIEIEEGYMFAGYAGSNDGNISGWHGGDDIWLVKLDFWGDIIWQKCLGGGYHEGPKYLEQDDEGNFIVIGPTQSNNGDVSGNHSLLPTDSDIWMVKVTESGDVVWQQCFGGEENETLQNGILKKVGNNYIIAGETNDESGDVLCTPHSWKNDYWIFEITMEDTTTVTNILNNVGFELYPNPAIDYVVFELEVQSSNFEVNEKRKIQISNVFGHEVAQLPLKSEKTVWDTRKIDAGLYIYIISIGEQIETGKIIIRK